MKNSENLNRDVNGTLQMMADGIQYFVIGKNRIRITEHFAEKRKTIGCIDGKCNSACSICKIIVFKE